MQSTVNRKFVILDPSSNICACACADEKLQVSLGVSLKLSWYKTITDSEDTVYVVKKQNQTQTHGTDADGLGLLVDNCMQLGHCMTYREESDGLY